MNIDLTYKIDSTKSADTFSLGEAVGKNLKGTEVIELISDLGGGKTLFVRGIASGMGSTDHVASPTFTISREYKAKKLELHHYDFYRLDNPGIVSNELQESIQNPLVVVAVEWSSIVRDILPNDRLRVSFKVTDEDSREIDFQAGPKHKHLLADIIKS